MITVKIDGKELELADGAAPLPAEREALHLELIQRLVGTAHTAQERADAANKMYKEAEKSAQVASDLTEGARRRAERVSRLLGKVYYQLAKIVLVPGEKLDAVRQRVKGGIINPVEWESDIPTFFENLEGVLAGRQREVEKAKELAHEAEKRRADTEDRLSNLATAIGAAYDTLYEGVEGRWGATPDAVKERTLSFFNAVVERYERLRGEKEKQVASLQKWLGHIYYAVTNKELPDLSNEDPQKTMEALEEALHVFERDLLRAKEEAEEIQRTKRELSSTVEQLTEALKRQVDKQRTVKQAAPSLDDHLALKRAYAQSLVENVVDNHLVGWMRTFERKVKDLSELAAHFGEQKRLIRCAQAYVRGNFEEARKESPFKDAIQLTHGYENEKYWMMYLQALALWNVWSRKENSEETEKKIRYARILRSKAREYQGIAPIDEIMHDITHEELPADDSDPPFRIAKELHQPLSKLIKEKGVEYALVNNAMIYLIDPQYKWAAYDLSACYDKLGKETEALVFIDIAEEVMKRHEDQQGLSWVYQRRGRMYQQKEGPQKAAVAYTESLEANPANEASRKGLQTAIETMANEGVERLKADPDFALQAWDIFEKAKQYLDEPLRKQVEEIIPHRSANRGWTDD